VSLNGERTHDRCVGVCYLEGVDISAEMVRRGVARDCPRFSGGRYRVIEASRVGRRDDRADVPAAGVLPREIGQVKGRGRLPLRNFWLN
jgi:hypothetical protein